MGIACVIRIAGAEVDSSTAAASNANQQYQTPKEHLTPPPQRQSIRQYIQSNLLPHRVQEPSWIQRIARFFGFDYGRKQYPPAPPLVNTQSPVKFPNTERSSTVQNTNQQYNSYNPNFNPTNGGPYPQNNNPSPYGNNQPTTNWNPNSFQSYQNQNLQNGPNGNQIQNQANQQQFYGNQQQQQQQQNQQNPNQNVPQFTNYQNNQQQQQQNQGQSQYPQNNNNNNGQQISSINSQNQNNGPPGGSSYPYPPAAPAPPPPQDTYSFQPSQQFQPSFGPYGQQQQNQNQQPTRPPPLEPPSNTYLPVHSHHQAPSPPQIITPPPTPPPSRRPESSRQLQLDGQYVPCNKSPWIPMYNGREIVDRPEKFLESTYLGGSTHAAHQPHSFYPGPSPPRQVAAQLVKINPHTNTWAHQVSSNLIVGTPTGFYTTPSSHRVVTSPEYLPPPGHLPIQHQQHPLVPIPIPNLSVTAIPPLYDYRPFSAGMNVNAGLQGPGGGGGGGNSGGGGGVTNIIIGTNVGHPNAPQNGFNNGHSSLKIQSNGGLIAAGIGNGPTSRPIIVSQGGGGGGGGYDYPKPNQIQDLLPPPSTNSHAGYQYPKPNVIPDLLLEGRHNSGKVDPKSQVESVQTGGNGNAYRNADLYNDFEIIKSIPIVHFSTAMENAGGQQPLQQPSSMDVPMQQGRMPQQPQQGGGGGDQMGLTVQPIIVGNQKREEKLTADSYTAASSHNFTIQEDNPRELQHLPINYVTEPPSYFLDNGQPLDELNNYENSPTDQPESDFTTISPQSGRDQDQEAPQNLLDSPIFYLKGAPKPFTSNRELSNQRPPFQAEENSNLPATRPDWLKSSPFREPGSLHVTTTAPLLYAPESSGMAPPPPPMAVDSINLITKRPKQIQIIIPYTTHNRPQPFRALDDSAMRGEVRVTNENYDKWANINQELHHGAEESKIIATATESPRKTTKYLTKILASSIRDLLNNERRGSKRRPFDILTLQKNIDDWTEQEFSVEPHKASTISLAGKSKSIPDEYLTTTPSMRELGLAGTTTEWYAQAETMNPEEEQLQNDQTVADNKIIQVRDDYLNNQEEEEEQEGFGADEGAGYWDKFKLAISPMTQEKVYVVTPQPWDNQLVFNNADAIKVEEEHKSSYKSPRFMVRPTPMKNKLPPGGASYVLGLTLSQSGEWEVSSWVCE